ncbi:MAG TPA: dUTPase [Ktedonobacterales bacterium]|nr:dUTPase [Ktedonobacterales bacterium]
MTNERLPHDETTMTANLTPEAPDLPTDHLADIFARQGDLAAFYREQRPDGFYSRAPMDRTLMWTRAIVHECCELDDELNWKPWKNGRPLDETRAARLDEMADILHFFVQLALDQGFSADEMYAAYLRKNAANRERQRSDPRYQPGQALPPAQAGDA